MATLLAHLGGLAGIAGAAVAVATWLRRDPGAAPRQEMADKHLADRLEALLPQTQCGQCTLGGCRPYAEALVRGQADTNQCPPGGDVTARRLAGVLGRPAKAVDPRFGDAGTPRLLAFIDEEACIGCALCLPACPVDAIVGAARHTHTVIAAECNGCKLCLAPCPVDCIEMWPAPGSVP